MLILQLAMPTPLYRVFDYIAPPGFSADQFKPGLRVKVPWRSDERVGFLLAVNTHSDVPIGKLKQAIEIIDDSSLFSDSVFSLLKFAASYYHYPMGEVFAAGLPNLLRQGKPAEYRHHYTPFESLPEIGPVLTDDQQKVVNQILNKINQFSPFLLFGVTGSGKTEIYLQVIAKIIEQNKQALVLVPEIGLTPQTVMRFQARFPVLIAVLHSGLTDRERHDAWLQAKNGDAKIIIGTRSAIFASLKNPGIIILDEEHDMSFKQQEGFRYSARDLALVRGQLEKIPVILGSATPSLESIYNAHQKRYELLNLTERPGSAVHAVFKIIDLRQQPKGSLTPLLLETIRRHLDHKNQVLIFINRRGFAPTLICHQCGWIAVCTQCDANMTLHQSPSQLQCHHCGALRRVDKICRECQGETLYPLGTGTERIEENLKDYFPGISIIRIDKDSTRKKGSLADKLASVHTGEPCISVANFASPNITGIIGCSPGVNVNPSAVIFSRKYCEFCFNFSRNPCPSFSSNSNTAREPPTIHGANVFENK